MMTEPIYPRSVEAEHADPIIIYGTTWCSDCKRAKRFLGDQRVPFEWHDIEHEPELLDVVHERNDGKNIIPTIVFPDETSPDPVPVDPDADPDPDPDAEGPLAAPPWNDSVRSAAAGTMSAGIATSGVSDVSPRA